MKKTDARKFNMETQQQIRYTAIELVKECKNYVEVAKILGIHHTSVSKWWKLYIMNGHKSLFIKKRGVKLWTNCKLKHKQMEELRKILIKNTPDQLGINFSLWTRKAIQSLIIKFWRISVCLVTEGRYMKRLDFTPQKPIKHACELNSKTVEKWLKTTYPKIAEKTVKERAETHWLDETKLNSYSNYVKSYSPKGKTSIVRMKAKRLSLNIISSISKLGKMRLIIYENPLNTKMFITFVRQLCKNTSHKLFLILDNLAVHHSKEFTK